MIKVKYNRDFYINQFFFFKTKVLGVDLGYRFLDILEAKGIKPLNEENKSSVIYEAYIFFYDNFFSEMFWYKKLNKTFDNYFGNYADKPKFLRDLLRFLHYLTRYKEGFLLSDFESSFKMIGFNASESKILGDYILIMFMDLQFFRKKKNIYKFADYEMYTALLFTNLIHPEFFPFINESDSEERIFYKSMVDYYYCLGDRIQDIINCAAINCIMRLPEKKRTVKLQNSVFDFVNFNYKPVRGKQLNKLLQEVFLEKVKLNILILNSFFALNFDKVIILFNNETFSIKTLSHAEFYKNNSLD